jgi:hypothetical protein
MLDDFKNSIVDKQIQFLKQIIITEIVYVIRMKMSFIEGEFWVDMDPYINGAQSDREEVEKISQYYLKRESLNEQQFIDMIQEVIYKYSNKDRRSGQDLTNRLHLHHWNIQ